MVDVCRSKLVNALSEVTQGIVGYRQLLFLLYEFFSKLEKKLISSADGFTLIVSSPGIRVTVAESLTVTSAR